MQRAVVTGGAGFIGSNLVDRLVDDGVDVLILDDLSSGSLANLKDARNTGNRSEERRGGKEWRSRWSPDE